MVDPTVLTNAALIATDAAFHDLVGELVKQLFMNQVSLDLKVRKAQKKPRKGYRTRIRYVPGSLPIDKFDRGFTILLLAYGQAYAEIQRLTKPVL